MPKVSIIMGVYNGEKRVGNAIESILNQTFTDWELIVCDDGSSDGSYELLKRFETEDKRIVAIRNPQNMGLAKTLNHCLEKAKGQYIARMDDDDYSHPERLETEVEYLDSHQEYAIVASGRKMIDENGIWGYDTNFGERTNIDIFKGNSFAHPTVMVRKEAYSSVGGYSTYPWIGREEDTDLWCKMYSYGYKGIVIDSILLDYFESRNSMARRKYKYRITESRIKLKYRKALHIPLYMSFWAIKPLIVGLIPLRIMEMIHHKRFN